MEKLKSTKLLGIVGAALTLIGTLLPFANCKINAILTTLNVKISFLSGRPGILVLLLALVSLAIIFADMIAPKVPFFEKLKDQRLVLIPVAISAVILIIIMGGIKNSDITVFGSTGKIKELGEMAKTSFSIGTWTMWLGLIMTAAYPFVNKESK